jgi:hypothetical protein
MEDGGFYSGRSGVKWGVSIARSFTIGRAIEIISVNK